MTRNVFVILAFFFVVAIHSVAGAAEVSACEGIVGKKCSASNEYCSIPAGKCRVADVAGTCRKKPETCTDDFKPVCGCDKKTYGNACEAARAGASVDFVGKCENSKK
jgi:hypothetical protein